jgi:hypothetical protein
MLQAHSAVLPGSEGICPVGTSVTVVFAKKDHQGPLGQSGEPPHCYLRDVVLKVIIDAVRCHIGKVLEM